MFEAVGFYLVLKTKLGRAAEGYMVIFSTLLRPYGSDSQPYESKPNHAPFRSKMVTTAMLRYEMNRRLGNRHCCIYLEIEKKNWKFEIDISIWDCRYY